MKKLNVAALFIGLGLALVTTSAFRVTDTLYGKDGSTWVSISGYSEGDPNGLDPGEYACVENQMSDCTALLESPSDTSPQEIRPGDFIYEPIAE